MQQLRLSLGRVLQVAYRLVLLLVSSVTLPGSSAGGRVEGERVRRVSCLSLGAGSSEAWRTRLCGSEEKECLYRMVRDAACVSL